MHDALLAHAPVDQADGLRRLFAGTAVQAVPLVANPHVAFGGVMIERLCAAFAERGKHTLVIDAADTSPPASDLAWLDLASCIEPLSESVSYLAARDLPIRHIDARGSTRAFLTAASDAAPQAQVLLVHAGASEIARLFATRGDASPMRPLLLCDDRPHSVTHAYASMKQLQQRGGFVVFDLLLGAAVTSPRAERIAAQLRGCADRFLGAVVRDWARIDPAEAPHAAAGTDLMRLVRDALRGADAPSHLPSVPPALSTQPRSVI